MLERGGEGVKEGGCLGRWDQRDSDECQHILT